MFVEYIGHCAAIGDMKSVQIRHGQNNDYGK